MDRTFYFEILYPFQDRVLQMLSGLETGFYLSGGTAASRGYLDHRFSDDLDLFVDDDDDRFGLWAARVIQGLSQQGQWRCEVSLQEERFVRLTLRENTERPVTVTEGTNTVVGCDPARIVTEALKILNGKGKDRQVPELWDGRAARRIVSVLG